ncbi:MAG: hypothetical protein ACJ78T_04685 [Myxococcales bacterium]
MLAFLATTLLVCAPGYPGSTAEAQPAMDGLARALSTSAHLTEGSLSAVYEEKAEGCLERLAQKDTALVLAALPFFLEHEKRLKLTGRLMAVPQDGEALQRWTLVAGKEHPASLTGFTVQSTAGYSKRFVHAMAPSLPRDVQIVASSTVLSSLRKAANGEKVAVLLDGAESAAVSKLPFAASLANVEASPPVPVALIATVDKRIDGARWKTLQAAFVGLSKDASAAEALQGVRTSAFVPLDSKALSAADAAWQRAK